MTKHRLRIEVKDGNVNAAWRQGNAEDRSSTPISFVHPFDEAALTDLRWYLEEYLSYPYGLEPEKAKKIEGQMQTWGQALFTTVAVSRAMFSVVRSTIYVAGFYHNLGVVAGEQRQFDTAIEYYKKSLEIREDAGDLHNAANQYHQLGRVAQEQFDMAIDLAIKALLIFIEYQDQH
jgi:tetratricopeptide (TPR) repeat protein